MLGDREVRTGTQADRRRAASALCKVQGEERTPVSGRTVEVIDSAIGRALLISYKGTNASATLGDKLHEPKASV